MGLFKKVFGDKALASGAARPAPSSEFPDSEAAPGTSWRALARSRREAVHVVLREAMRQHAIPTDWIESRLLADVDDARLLTFCVLLHVRDGQSSLQGYAPTFQASFIDALHRFDPRSREWLASVCWTFAPGPDSTDIAAAAATTAATRLPPGADADFGGAVAPSAPDEDKQELEEDLQALFAIRDAALRVPPRTD